MYILLIISIIIIVLLIFTIKSKKQEVEQINKKNSEISNKYSTLQNKLINDESIRLNQQIIDKQTAYKNLLSQIDELSNKYKNFSASTKEQIKQEIEDWKKASILNASNEIDQCINNIRESSFNALQQLLDLYNEEKEEKQTELFEIEQILEEYKTKQQIINEEILRRRAIEEQTDFYRVVLSEDSLNDIALLKSIRQNLHCRENLDKLIYDSYIAKPVNEMVKRVLNGKQPSGIYKITRLNTGEIYIGKSTNVKERFQQHAKTSFNCGTIAHSVLHTTIAKDGIQNFTFELLEEVPKEQLSEREKYYIDFYQSKSYGLNEKAGG